MKYRNFFSVLAIILLTLWLFNSCSKDKSDIKEDLKLEIREGRDINGRIDTLQFEFDNNTKVSK